MDLDSNATYHALVDTISTDTADIQKQPPLLQPPQHPVETNFHASDSASESKQYSEIDTNVNKATVTVPALAEPALTESDSACIGILSTAIATNAQPGRLLFALLQFESLYLNLDTRLNLVPAALREFLFSVIVSYLQQHQNATDISSDVESIECYATMFHCLSRICGSKDKAFNNEQLVNKKGIELCVYYMNTYADHRGMQITVSKCLISIMNENSKHQVLAGKLGCIPGLLAALRRHSDDILVLPHVCEALMCASRVSDNRKIIVHSRGVPLVITRMTQHSDSLNFQTCACALLDQIARDRSGRLIVHECNAIPVVIACISRYIMHSNILVPAIGVLGSLADTNVSARNDPIPQQIHDAGGTAAVLLSMQIHRTEAYLQSYALHMLYSMCTANGGKLKDAVKALNPSELIQEAQRAFPNDRIIQKWTTTLLDFIESTGSCVIQ